MTENKARQEICRVGKSLFDRGYVHASAGNISVRLDASEGGGFLITPTDACLGFLDPEQLARVDDAGRQTSGARASKTIVLHRRIYEATQALGSGARCVVHTHSTYCVALTLAERSTTDASMNKEGSLTVDVSTTADAQRVDASATPRELLPALTPYFVMKVGRVPIIDYYRPGDERAGVAVTAAIERYAARGILLRAVMLERLGPNVWHDSPAAAMGVLEELEETAKLWHLSGRRSMALSSERLAELDAVFGAKW